MKYFYECPFLQTLHTLPSTLSPPIPPTTPSPSHPPHPSLHTHLTLYLSWCGHCDVMVLCGCLMVWEWGGWCVIKILHTRANFNNYYITLVTLHHHLYDYCPTSSQHAGRWVVHIPIRLALWTGHFKMLFRGTSVVPITLSPI